MSHGLLRYDDAAAAVSRLVMSGAARFSADIACLRFAHVQQKKNLVSLDFWRMLKDVRRFGVEAPKVLDDDETYRNMSLGNYLDKHKYSRSFTYNYVLPMCAAIWSVSNKRCLEFSIQVRGAAPGVQHAARAYHLAMPPAGDMHAAAAEGRR